MFLGIDAGSTFTKVTLIDAGLTILFQRKFRTNPDLPEILQETIQNLKIQWGSFEMGICGYGQDLVPQNATRMTELKALSQAFHHYLPSIKTIFDVGGQDIKVLKMENGRIS